MSLTPSVVVEIAFGFGPLDEPADGDFINISSATVKVTDVAIARGRPSEFDNYPPSTAQITVADLNRVLDPSNTASIYNGQLLPRVPIRIRGKIGATYYPRFRGFVDGWPMQLADRHTAVTIVATDAFKVLAGIQLGQSAYDDAVLDDSPNAYWKLGEQGATATDSGAGRYDGRYAAPNNPRGAQIVPYGDNGSLEMSGGANEAVTVIDTGARVDALPVSLDMWVESDAGTQSEDRILFLQPGYSTNEGFLLATGYAGAAGQSIYLSYTGANVAYSILTVWPKAIYDGSPHHIALVIDTSRRDLYVDGALVTPYSNTAGSASALGVTPIYIGSYVGLHNSFPGRISNVALYDTALSAADILTHYEAGSYPFSADSSGDRVDQVLDLIDWPVSLRSVDNGEMLLAPADFAGRTALDYLQTIAASEQGRLFISNDGKVVFHQRDRFLTQATENTSQFTFSDDGAGDASYGSLSYSFDDRFVYNEAQVQRDGGNPIRVSDPTSVAAYGPHGRSLSGLLLLDDGTARAIGEYIVFRYKDPQVRADQWSLHPQANADSWADVFALEIGHRVTLESTPARKGSQMAVDLHVEQITERINASANDWLFTYAGSPVDPNAANYFTFGGTSAQSFGNGLWR